VEQTIKKIIINTTEQYIILGGESKQNKPVLLFLHGGPGVPELFTMKKEMQYLEEKFVVIYWEQRGAGKSYRVKDLTLEQILLDTEALTQWLLKEYNQDKLYLMGHSWGTLLGMLAIEKSPQRYYAYMGIGQVTNQYEAEQNALEWIKKEAIRREDKKAIYKLSTLNMPSKSASIKEWSDFLNLHRSYLWKYGGSFYNSKGVLARLVKNFLFAREYSIIEKIMFLPSAIYSLKQLWADVVAINLFDEIKKVKVPIYIFQGLHDYQVSYTLAKEFIDGLDAPKKRFFLFKNSAHSPHIEENDKFNECIDRVLDNRVNE
jgi:pimeloyl-ACP methyl ester carboxylesterase